MPLGKHSFLGFHRPSWFGSHPQMHGDLTSPDVQTYMCFWSSLSKLLPVRHWSSSLPVQSGKLLCHKILPYTCLPELPGDFEFVSQPCSHIPANVGLKGTKLARQCCMVSYQILNWTLAAKVAKHGGKSTRLGVQSSRCGCYSVTVCSLLINISMSQSLLVYLQNDIGYVRPPTRSYYETMVMFMV